MKRRKRLEISWVETSTRVFGEEHPDTLWSIANLAVTYTDQGRFEEAETLEYRLVETTKRTRGEEHPDTMWRIAYLAGTYYRLGRFEEAEALRNQLLETRKKGTRARASRYNNQYA